MRRKLENLKYIKIILMMAIVLLHACRFWGSSDWIWINPVTDSPLVGLVSEWLSHFAIYAYVIASGYIFAYKMIKTKDYATYFGLVRKKALRLLVPYVLTSLLWIIPITSFFADLSWDDIIMNYVLGISPSQLWFLLMLFDVFLIAWPLSKWLLKNSVKGLLFSVLFYFVGMTGAHFFLNIFCIWTAFKSFIFFFIGMHIYRLDESEHKESDWRILLGLDIIIFGIWLWLFKTNSSGIFTSGLWLLARLIGSIASLTVLNEFIDRTHSFWCGSRFMRLLSSKCMIIYCVHQQIMYFTIYVFNGKIHPVLHAGVNFAVALAGSILIATCLEWLRRRTHELSR